MKGERGTDQSAGAAGAHDGVGGARMKRKKPETKPTKSELRGRLLVHIHNEMVDVQDLKERLVAAIGRLDKLTAALVRLQR